MTNEGTISDHALKISGSVKRKAPEQDGPCKKCLKMFELGTIEQLAQTGFRCPHANRKMPGHIWEYPAPMETIMNSPEFNELFDKNSARYVKAAKARKGQSL